MYRSHHNDPVRTVIAVIIGFCFIVAILKINEFLDWIDSHFYTFLWAACVVAVSLYWFLFGYNNHDDDINAPPKDYPG